MVSLSRPLWAAVRDDSEQDSRVCSTGTPAPQALTHSWCGRGSASYPSYQPSGAGVPVEQNPGVLLGIILGTAAHNGRDKLTILTSPGLSALARGWNSWWQNPPASKGKGIVPVDREQPGVPDVYGHDRLFAYVRLSSDSDKAQEGKVAALERAGQPVVRILVGDVYDLGQEFFRWEIATAVAGSLIGINPFNQPDVEASKIATRSLTNGIREDGFPAAESPVLEDGGIQLFTDSKNAEALAKAAGSDKSLVDISALTSSARAPAIISPCLLYPDERRA